MLLSFVVTVIVVYVSSFWWMTPFITYITRAHVSLHAFSFTEMIQIYVMIIFFIAFCFISPVMFYQLWAFIAPPDLTLNILLTLPLILLFEFSTFIVKFTYRGKPPTH
ncbi:twin-arginine translocase subunit TatC [Staphylococcus aureus]|nr:twin-arginine translocase subunit TatC [Staphylococcus aureus]